MKSSLIKQKWLTQFINKKPFQPEQNFCYIQNGVAGEIPDILKKHLPSIQSKDVRDVSLTEVIFGKYRFAKELGKVEIFKEGYLRYWLIKHCYTNYKPVAEIWEWMDFIFSPTSEKCIKVPGVHVVEILQTHFPDWNVEELEMYAGNESDAKLIYELAQQSLGQCTDLTLGTTVICNTLNPYLLRAYRILHPNKEIHLRIHDGIDYIRNTAFRKASNEDIRQIIKELLQDGVVNSMTSYNAKEAQMLGIGYYPNAVSSAVMQSINTNVRNYIYAFVGGYDDKGGKSRFDAIERIRKSLQQWYPSTEHHIYSRIVHFNQLRQQRLSYSAYLDIIGKSEIVIDLYRVSPDEGYSYRISEAIVLGRKIITNRNGIKQADFYHPTRVFVLGEDADESLQAFIESEYRPIPASVKMNYECVRMYW